MSVERAVIVVRLDDPRSTKNEQARVFPFTQDLRRTLEAQRKLTEGPEPRLQRSQPTKPPPASTPPSRNSKANLISTRPRRRRRSRRSAPSAQRQQLTEEKRRLDADAEWVEKSYKDERLLASNLRLEHYLAYFELLEEEKGVLQELYAPLKQALANQGSHAQKLDVVCRVKVMARSMAVFGKRSAASWRAAKTPSGCVRTATGRC
ncbi:MAG TPA: hypothetical protein VI485_03255 [Vicinamibacterales bacterium]|nr:hypothetical protein [Vicinamibacterales bacterium]